MTILEFKALCININLKWLSSCSAVKKKRAYSYFFLLENSTVLIIIREYRIMHNRTELN